LNVGQEGIFFLQSDSAQAFCRQIEYGLPIAKLDHQFDNAQKLIATVVSVYADPIAALSTGKLTDRQFAALALVARYRTGRAPFGRWSQVDEPISTEESRRILDTLAGMKWTDPPLDAAGVMSLPSAFRQLQLTEKDGWREPQLLANDDPNAVLGKAVAVWLSDYAAKYRIQRRVFRETDSKPMR
jgi:hypothetical protein